MKLVRLASGWLASYWNAFLLHLLPGFPLRLENLEKWEGSFQSGKSQGILNRLEKSGKITKHTGKFREFQTNIVCYFLYLIELCIICYNGLSFQSKKKHLKKYWQNGKQECIKAGCILFVAVAVLGGGGGGVCPGVCPGVSA